MYTVRFASFSVVGLALLLAACTSSRSTGDTPVDASAGHDLGAATDGAVADTGVAPDGGGTDGGGARDTGVTTDATAGDGGPDAGVVSVPAACAMIATTRCSRLDTCSMHTFLAHDYGDMATCVARIGENCARSLLAPGTSASDATVTACDTALAAQTCADFAHGVTPTACLPLPGTRTTGMPCGFAAQCASTFCALHHGMDCGTCATEPVAGASCATVGCGRDLVCDATTVTCVMPTLAGGACPRTNDNCDSGLACVGATATAMGTCMTEGATVGATCDARRRTASDCDRTQGLFCSATTSMCTLLTTGAPGAACGTAAPGTLCSEGGDCNGTVCRAAAADGAACDNGPGPYCMKPATCIGTTDTSDAGIAGTCQLPDPARCG